jgi:hypothetical protein
LITAVFDGNSGLASFVIKHCYYQPNCKLFKDPLGPEPWYQRNDALSDWETNFAVLEEVSDMGMDIKAMDYYGTYNIPWPITADDHLCYGPTPDPTPSPSMPTLSPTML